MVRSIYRITLNHYTYIELGFVPIGFEIPDLDKPNGSKVYTKNTIINNTRYENRVIKYVIIYITGNPEASCSRLGS